MNKIIPIILLIILAGRVYGQYAAKLVPHSTDPAIRQLVIEATKYLNGVGGVEPDLDMAREMLEQAAKENEPVAQFMLGQIYEYGKGVDVHLQKAFKYYQLSAENGEKEAMLKLGDFHKKGKGTELDFKKAAKYFYKSSELGSPRGNYSLGYMHFKGLGVDQNYEKAYYLFVLGAKEGFPPAVFMLGICYEQGFFVEVDLQKAIDCYKYSASYNYKQAQVRLQELESGKQKSVQIRQDNSLHTGFQDLGLIPVDHNKVNENLTSDILINGEWEGELVIYDWSGKEIIETQTVKLTINQKGHSIETKWNSDMTYTQSTGHVHGNKVYFDKLNLVTDNAFGGYTHKNIADFTLSSSKENDFVYLVGNITSTIPSDKEPGAPGFIVLRQPIKSSSKAILAIDKPEILTPLVKNDLNFNVYPNPFDNKINVEFEVETAGNVSIFLYNSVGERIKTIKAKDNYQPGRYSYDFKLQVTPGAYVIGIENNGRLQTRKLIKY